MIVTIICDIPLSRNNGTAVAAGNLINALKERGHEVRVVCPDENLWGKEGYFITQKRNFGPFNKYVAKNGVTLAKPDEKMLLKAISGADIIHCIMPFSLSAVAVRIARELNIPVSAGFHCQAENVTNHMGLEGSRPANKLVYRRFYRRIYSKCDCIHYPTVFIRNEFERQCNKRTNGYVISNGVDAEFFGCKKGAKKDGKFTILCTGRYSHEKAQGVLIDAVKKSAHEGEIRLVFAGSGPMEAELKKRAEGLTNPPVFAFMSRSELVKTIEKADLYVHTANVEIEAISCLEAICGGLVPVIADSDKSATRGFAMGANNLFKSGDADDLAKKIDFFIDEPYEAEKCRLLYMGFAGRFEKERCMDEMENMLARTVLACKGEYGVPVTEFSQRAALHME